MSHVETMMKCTVPRGTPQEVVAKSIRATQKLLRDAGFDPGHFRMEIRHRIGPWGRDLYAPIAFVKDEAPGDVKERWSSRHWIKEQEERPDGGPSN